MACVPTSAIRENKDMLRGCNKQSEGFSELRASIKAKGILNSITVRDLGDGTYGLIDGLQRWQACLDLAVPEIPANIITIADAEILEAQIVANVQKIETKPVEYTKALLKLLSMNPAMTMGDLARRLGKSLSWLSDRFHLLKLSDAIQALVNEDKIVLANAYALAKIPPEFQEQFLDAAQTQPTTEFVPSVQKFVKEHKDAARQGRPVNADAFSAVPHFQKMADVKAELDAGKVAEALVSTYGITTAVEGFKMGLQWALHLDPSSIEAARKKFEAKKAEMDAAKKKRAEERAAKKAAEATAAVATV